MTLSCHFILYICTMKWYFQLEHLAFQTNSYCSIEFYYGNGTRAFAGLPGGSEHLAENLDEVAEHICHLEKGEYITNITLYETVKSGDTIQCGFTFVTDKKTCGPYGQVTDTSVDIVSGGRLLFMHGHFDVWFQRVTFAFDIC